MQKVKIPVTIDPYRTAQKRSSFDGILQLQNLTRLSEQLSNTDGDVAVIVHCGNDEQGLVYIEGEAQCTVQVRCERCGDEMTLNINSSFAYTPVKGDDSAQEEIPQRYDVIETD